VLALYRKVSGPEHPTTLSAMGNLAVSSYQAGHRDEVLKILEELLPLRRKVLGAEHPDTLSAMGNLALVYREAGRFGEAISMQIELLENISTVRGPEHPDALHAMGILAYWYHLAGRFDEALETRVKLLALWGKVRGPEHRDTLNAMGLLADCYRSAGRVDEAIAKAEELLALCRKVLGPEDDSTLRTMTGLVDVYEEIGRMDKAIAMREELRAHLPKMHGAVSEDSPEVRAVVVAPTSEWKWLHPTDGVDPADSDPDFHTTFFTATFDDANWTSGVDSAEPGGGFGYGDDWFEGVDIGEPASKELGKSAYFRHRFTTDQEHANLELRCQRDDGIIVYLDGKEVARDNMREGEEAYRLPAADAVSGDDEKTIYRIPLEGVILPAGEHFLAISLHNPGEPSSDLRIGGITLVEVEDEALDLKEAEKVPAHQPQSPDAPSPVEPGEKPVGESTDPETKTPKKTGNSCSRRPIPWESIAWCRHSNSKRA
jgi:tetratricopeptide (TPR) repeat protein